MDLLFTYDQEVNHKHNKNSKVKLEVLGDDSNIEFISYYYYEYLNNTSLTMTHKLNLDINTGDFIVTYENKNNNKITKKIKKNDFNLLQSLLSSGIGKSENIKNFWGSQYKKSIDRVYTIFYNKVKHNFINDYYNKSLFNHKSTYSFIYRLIVNVYLDKRGIKSHDGIYSIIEDDFPAKKWLDKNDNNFLPAILDSYGIKCKYFIKEINSNPTARINLRTLKYLCNLFDDGYIDYIKQIDWKWCSILPITYKKIHILKTDYQKRMMVKIINELKENNSTTKGVIQLINLYLYNLDEIKKINIDLKFKYNNVETFYKTFDELQGILKHQKRGFRIKYSLPSEFVDVVQQPIQHDGLVFIPKILLTEEDFIIEGHLMKNCMATQFSHGIIFIYISFKCGNNMVNLQYQKGKLIQSRGKANGEIDEMFKRPINILTDRLMSNSDIKWIKEKFDII